jgi:hypothetical protein
MRNERRSGKEEEPHLLNARRNRKLLLVKQSHALLRHGEMKGEL